MTFIALKLLGESFNLMTLGGLAAAVGLVIDDAIVVVENIVLHRDAGEGRLQAIQSAVREITVPLVGSTVTPVVVFLPLISMTGVDGHVLPRPGGHHVGVVVYLARPGTGLDAESEPSPAAEGRVMPTARRSRRRFRNLLPSPRCQEEMRTTLAAEEATITGFFGRIIRFYERWLRRALRHPVWLGALCAVLIVASYLLL